MVLEADEYQNKLKFYKPRGALINNIDYDHPDFFTSVEMYEQVYIDFMKSMPKKGWLVVNNDDKRLKSLAPANTRARVITYAINETADYVAYDIKQVDDKLSFKVKLGSDEFEEDEVLSDTELGDFAISLSGNHNVSNIIISNVLLFH